MGEGETFCDGVTWRQGERETFCDGKIGRNGDLVKGRIGEGEKP